ncbi:MAG: carbohydrate binding domain-containing protein, partial [Candidatus Hodarchaeota archaeon]
MKVGQKKVLKNIYFNSFLLILIVVTFLFPMISMAQNQKVLIIDRFEQWKKSELGGNADVFADEDGKATILMEAGTGTNALDNKGKSINFKYNVVQADGYCGYYSQFPDLDLGEYHYLSFWIKGKNGKEYMRIQLKNDSESASVALWDYLVGGTEKTWRKVMIPLDAFWNLSSLQRIKELVFVFENYQSSENESPLESEVFIDDVVVGSFFPGFVKLDHFDDKIRANATGGNIGEFSYPESHGLYTSEINCQMYHNNPCGFEVHYDNSGISDFGGEFFILGGGDDGWTKIYKNLSKYSTLHLALRAAENENPGNLKIELKESSTTHIKKITDIKTNFQEEDLKFTEFSPAIQNYDNIGEFTIVFEKGAQEKLKGVVHFDEIEFRRSWYTGSDKTPSPKPSKLKINGQQPSECLYVSGNMQIQTSFNIDLSRFESVRLEYRGDKQTSWTVAAREYQTNNNTYNWQIDVSDLPKTSVFDLRAVAQNYNGNETSSELSYIKTALLNLTLSDLFYNSFQFFNQLRNDKGIYRDALVIDGNHYHPASVATIGMGLVSLCIADAMKWTNNAKALAVSTLRSITGQDANFNPDRNASGYFRHFIDMDTGRKPENWNSEYSSIDTGILVAGALFCRNYFRDNTVETLFDLLNNSINWSKSIANVETGEIYRTFSE